MRAVAWAIVSAKVSGVSDRNATEVGANSEDYKPLLQRKQTLVKVLKMKNPQIMLYLNVNGMVLTGFCTRSESD